MKYDRYECEGNLKLKKNNDSFYSGLPISYQGQLTPSQTANESIADFQSQA